MLSISTLCLALCSDGFCFVCPSGELIAPLVLGIPTRCRVLVPFLRAQHFIGVLFDECACPLWASLRLFSCCRRLSTPSLSWALGSGVHSFALLAWLQLAASIMLSTPSLSWALGSGVLNIALLAWLHFAMSIYSTGHPCSSTLCASLHVVVVPTSQASGLHLRAVRLAVEFSTFALLAWLQLAASSYSRVICAPVFWRCSAHHRVVPAYRRHGLALHQGSCLSGAGDAYQCILASRGVDGAARSLRLHSTSACTIKGDSP